MRNVNAFRRERTPFRHGRVWCKGVTESIHTNLAVTANYSRLFARHIGPSATLQKWKFHCSLYHLCRCRFKLAFLTATRSTNCVFGDVASFRRQRRTSRFRKPRGVFAPLSPSFSTMPYTPWLCWLPDITSTNFSPSANASFSTDCQENAPHTRKRDGSRSGPPCGLQIRIDGVISVLHDHPTDEMVSNMVSSNGIGLIVASK